MGFKKLKGFIANCRDRGINRDTGKYNKRFGFVSYWGFWVTPDQTLDRTLLKIKSWYSNECVTKTDTAEKKLLIKVVAFCFLCVFLVAL